MPEGLRGRLLGGRFRVEERVGAGGMGVVHRARDERADQLVALKRLHRGVSRARFEREVEAIARLAHPRVVAYVAHGVDEEGHPWIATEWLEGVTLEDALRERRLAPRDALPLGRGVAEALAHAHARRVVHRDLKPANLFLPGGDPAAVRVLDFGVARLEDAVRLTEAGATVGTPGYMAPEQARGDDRVGPAADLYGLGCVLWECLLGRPPFGGSHAIAVLAKVLLEELPSIADRAPGLPPALAALVNALLAKDPARRPASADEVAARLAAIDAGALQEVPADLAESTEALTTDERRLVAVVLLRAPTPGPEDATLPAPRDDDDPALEAVARRHGARVERLADGSAVLHVSGSGVATDLAAAAARCALALAERWPERALALATGRREGTRGLPVGGALDRAASLIDAPREAGVPMDEVSASLVEARFVVTPGAPPRLRAERHRPTTIRPVAGRSTPCVGRERELAWLRDAVTETHRRRRPSAALVVGPAGLGKSRLAHELARALRDEGIRCVWAAAHPLGADVPFGLAAALLRASLEGEGDDEESALAHLPRWLEAHAPGAPAAFGRGLRALLRPDEAAPDPTRRGDLVRHAFHGWVDAELARGPRVWILDDLHWADAPSVELLGHALRGADRALSVVGLARPALADRFPRLWAGRASTLALPELDPAAAAALIDAVLGEVDPARREELVDQAAGHPFLLEELLRAEARGQPRDTPPDSVLAMVQARLEGLPEDARRALRAASVLGPTLEREAIAALLGSAVGQGQVDGWLDLLVDAEILDRLPARAFGEPPRHRFRHALLREAAYGTLTEPDRRAGHRRAARWLAEGPAPEPAIVAEHYRRGGRDGSAASWYARAAERALGANELGPCERWAELAVTLGAEGEARGRALLCRAEASIWRGDHRSGERHASAALGHLPPGDPLAHRGAALLFQGLGRCGEGARLESAVGRLRDRGTTRPGAEGPDPRWSASGQIALAQGARELFRLGRYEAGRAILDALPREAPSAEARGWRALALAMQALAADEPGRARDRQREARDAFAEAEDLRMACSLEGEVGFASALLGDLEAAREGLESCGAQAAVLGLAHVETWARGQLAQVLVERGEHERAARLAAEAADAFARQGDARLEGATRAYAVRAQLGRGDVEAALREARRAALLLAPFPPLAPLGHAALARAELAAGDPGAARAAAEEAMRRLEEVGQLEEGEAEVRLVFGLALEAAGDAEAARETFAVGAERVRAQAARIQDPALRALFLERVPAHAELLARARRP
ncbi:MAG TPA: protein kinase [Polyangiaceae bacterium LLY-WYZ-15_(1-7)]|nr:protein kinase [Polyangiaceae bacterium LLY-WYZ-15_(1-7)]HJL11355.1 protein kinase [Polyangiaceae bacterium LLY-WYZ-15_(1-7)]